MVVIGSLGIRGYAKMGAFVRVVLISEKALSVSAVHWKGRFFSVKWYKGSAMSEKFWMKEAW